MHVESTLYEFYIIFQIISLVAPIFLENIYYFVGYFNVVLGKTRVVFNLGPILFRCWSNKYSALHVEVSPFQLLQIWTA